MHFHWWTILNSIIVGCVSCHGLVSHVHVNVSAVLAFNGHFGRTWGSIGLASAEMIRRANFVSYVNFWTWAFIRGRQEGGARSVSDFWLQLYMRDGFEVLVSLTTVNKIPLGFPKSNNTSFAVFTNQRVRIPCLSLFDEIKCLYYWYVLFFRISCRINLDWGSSL